MTLCHCNYVIRCCDIVIGLLAEESFPVAEITFRCGLLSSTITYDVPLARHRIYTVGHKKEPTFLSAKRTTCARQNTVDCIGLDCNFVDKKLIRRWDSERELLGRLLRVDLMTLEGVWNVRQYVRPYVRTSVRIQKVFFPISMKVTGLWSSENCTFQGLSTPLFTMGARKWSPIVKLQHNV